MFSRARIHSWGGPVAALLCILACGTPALAGPHHKGKKGPDDKLDEILALRADRKGTSRVIVTFAPGRDGSDEVRKAKGLVRQRLDIINGVAAELPNKEILKLAHHPDVFSIHFDRPIGAQLNNEALTVGARAVQQQLGLDGSGVGVAIIDSGVTSWHDDLTYSGLSTAVLVKGGQRVAAFVDFVNGRPLPYDDNGHGTHVAGIVAGNGFDSRGGYAGIAPGAHIASLKVLDGRGRGTISNVIGALQWVIQNRAAYRLRVVNLSVGAPITESYDTDPLTLAAKRVVDAGIVVVTAAGNLGTNAAGQPQYGAITAPGNAPWVLTVGASDTRGTPGRGDDTVASFSSRGPTALDYSAKPDILAPGTGIVSLSDPTSAMYLARATSLVDGLLPLGYKPYLALSGTSMAAPIVSGTVALMLQANPSLTPNLVKAILQYTAQDYGYNALTEGTGFLNTKGAVDLARFYRNPVAQARFHMPNQWSKRIIWGNYELGGGVINPFANAWAAGTVWGSAFRDRGDNIVWGTVCDKCDDIVWGTTLDIVWGTLLDDIVWGTARLADNIVWGTMRDASDNIVWGTARFSDNIVWGTDCGGRDCDDIVWGTARMGDDIVWGTARFDDNIVWGTSGNWDDIVWGTSADDIVWGTSDDSVVVEVPPVTIQDFSGINFEDLFTPIVGGGL